MARKSSKQARNDSMNQYALRKHLKKNSPKGKNDGKDWASFLLKQLQKGRSDDGN